jgi:hypothetical protein
MSAEATSWAMFVSKSQETARLVLLLMADATGQDGICGTSLEYLATTSRLPRLRVERALEQLEHGGDIRRVMDEGGRALVMLSPEADSHARFRAAEGRRVYQLASEAVSGNFKTEDAAAGQGRPA